MLFLYEKGMYFTNFTKGKGYFLTVHSEKGYQFQNVEHIV